MPLVPALVMLAALGLCFIYGYAAAGNPELLQLRTARELCWALLILQFGSRAQRRQLRLILLCRQTAVTRRALGYHAAPQQLRAVPELCDSCRETIAARRYPVRGRQELEQARARVRQGYRVSRQQVEDAWRQAEAVGYLSPTGQFLLGMIGKEELRERCMPPGGTGVTLQGSGQEEPGGD